MGDLESVRVALRVRPLVSSEKARGCQVAVEKIDGANQVLVNKTDAFSFNFVFDWRDTQEQVYKLAVSDMLDKLFSGFNATILAYGQTGSGKTHTMGTAFDGSLDEDVGVIPRAMHDIFERIKKLSDEFDFVIKCSFMELYQEHIYDLLSQKSRKDSVIDMRGDRSGIIMVGLTEKEVFDAKETTDCLVKGSMGRVVASTAMNQQSSRSHCIFTVTLQATKKDESCAVTTSKFRLVDLAGSERLKKTDATGNRFKEGVKINQGLLTLGNVISALGDGKGTGFVRYRDSKLTRLLQNSLGGNSVTLMIACVSPAAYNVAETLSTLRYADRARKIKNKPIVNQDPHAAEINRLKGIIQKLRVELLIKGAYLMHHAEMEIMDQKRRFLLMQLKNKDCKMQNEMARKEALHNNPPLPHASASSKTPLPEMEIMDQKRRSLLMQLKNKDCKMQNEMARKEALHINPPLPHASASSKTPLPEMEIMDQKRRSLLMQLKNKDCKMQNEMARKEALYINPPLPHASASSKTPLPEMEIMDQKRRSLLMQLKNKDCKMQNEMARKEALHINPPLPHASASSKIPLPEMEIMDQKRRSLLMQLKNKDCKMQNEMARKEALHSNPPLPHASASSKTPLHLQFFTNTMAFFALTGRRAREFTWK